jgi:hypothetical protein
MERTAALPIQSLARGVASDVMPGPLHAHRTARQGLPALTIARTRHRFIGRGESVIWWETACFSRFFADFLRRQQSPFWATRVIAQERKRAELAADESVAKAPQEASPRGRERTLRPG